MTCNHTKAIDVFGNSTCPTCNAPKEAIMLDIDGASQPDVKRPSICKIQCPYCNTESKHKYDPARIKNCANCRKAYRLPFERYRT